MKRNPLLFSLKELEFRLFTTLRSEIIRLRATEVAVSLLEQSAFCPAILLADLTPEDVGPFPFLIPVNVHKSFRALLPIAPFSPFVLRIC